MPDISYLWRYSGGKGISRMAGHFAFKLLLTAALLAPLSACDDNPTTAPDPRLAELDVRAHNFMDKIANEDDLKANSGKDVSDVVCTGIGKMPLPSTTGNFGDVGIISVPGSTVPPPLNASNFPPVPPVRIPFYQILLAYKHLDFMTPVGIMLIYNPATGNCQASIWNSGP
jgi:hypothetical protein